MRCARGALHTPRLYATSSSSHGRTRSAPGRSAGTARASRRRQRRGPARPAAAAAADGDRGGQRHRPPRRPGSASSRPAATVPPAAHRGGRRPGDGAGSGARRRASRPVAAAMMPAQASRSCCRRRGRPGRGAASGYGHRPAACPGAAVPAARRRCRIHPAAEPAGQPDPVLMGHGGSRLVPHVPAASGQPPDEVDVLPHRQVLGEPDRVRGRGRRHADHEGRARHVRHLRAGPHDARHLPHVQRRAPPSYRASQARRVRRSALGRPARSRGAAAATAGSAKCGSSGSSQPGAAGRSPNRGTPPAACPPRPVPVLGPQPDRR